MTVFWNNKENGPYAHMYVYVNECICMCVCMFVSVLFVCVYACVFICMYVYMYIRLYMYVRMCVYVYIDIYVCVYNIGNFISRPILPYQIFGTYCRTYAVSCFPACYFVLFYFIILLFTVSDELFSIFLLPHQSLPHARALLIRLT